jgi:chemotaxis protein MotB
MIQRKPHLSEPHTNHERWLLTYADMITLLAAFFLMLYSMSVVSKGKFEAMVESVRTGFGGSSISNSGAAVTRGVMHAARGKGVNSGVMSNNDARRYQEAMRDLRRFVEQHHLSGGVETRSDERGDVISLMSDDMLFNRGQAVLRPTSLELLARIANVLRPLPNEIEVEGHTCNLPIHTDQFPSNWELSTARAGTVLRFFIEVGGMPAKRFKAAGYADTRPLVLNDSEAHRAHNRRVEIVLLKTEAERIDEIKHQLEIQRVTAGNTGTQNR